MRPAGGSAPHIGLVVAAPRRPGSAAAAVTRWLLGAATVRTDLTLAVAPPGAPLPEYDAYVVVVAQHGPSTSPAARATVVGHALQWAGRPVGVVAYGGITRGRAAAAEVRAAVGAAGAEVIEVGPAVNTALPRRDGGVGPVEELGWEMLLDGLVGTCAARATVR